MAIDDEVARFRAEQKRDEELGAETPRAKPWPVIDPKAFHGVLGDMVRAIEPHSEADPIAILVQSIVAFGSVIGRHPYWIVEDSHHHANLFAVVVGATSKGRKGTSWGRVKHVFGLVDSEWAAKCTRGGGLSSGEGLIYQVRDDSTSTVKGKQVVEPGVIDKRLLVVEPEMASVFKVMQREGSTLSPIVRSAWDTGDLQPMTKNSRVTATGAHISVIGHITKDEVLKSLSDVDITNGFGNRILWLMVKRSKSLPHGGSIHPDDMNPIVLRLREAVEYSKGTRLVRCDEKARAMWESIYTDLSEGAAGLIGAMTSRAEAQVMRLAMIYAIADMEIYIRTIHLEAALALWNYSASSCLYIFGDRLGDETADEIVSSLARSPKRTMTRTEIRDLWKRHKKNSEITRALQVLEERKIIERGQMATGGRPVETWTLLSQN